MKKLMIRFVTTVVEPTAAKANGDANRPTTMWSADVNVNCNNVEQNSGHAKTMISRNSGPWHMSMVYLWEWVFIP